MACISPAGHQRGLACQVVTPVGRIAPPAPGGIKIPDHGKLNPGRMNFYFFELLAKACNKIFKEPE